jgi:hypothetical protein
MLKVLSKNKEKDTLPAAPNIDAFNWQHLKPKYQELMNLTIKRFSMKLIS